MKFRWTATFCLLGCFAASPGWAQRSSIPSAGSTTNNGTTTGRFPNSNTNTNNTPYPGNNNPTPVFIDGKVLFEDGTPGNSNVRIERVCNGNVRLQGHADGRGDFYFQLGQINTVDTDAADSSGPSMPGSRINSPINTGGFGTPSRSLAGCEVRAAYPGYRSDVYSVPFRNDMDGIHVGTLILHRLAAVQGTTLSLTTALAPKKAQKEYEKGMQLTAKGKFEEAENQLTAATNLYPKYAIAWFALGELQRREGKLPEAKHSYQAAIDADSRYVSPYDQMAALAGEAMKWQESADLSAKVLGLNPVEFPEAYWYNAVANYNLHNFDAAEKDSRTLLKIDTAHQYPKAEIMLANVLEQKGDMTGAAEHMRAYLTISPNAKDADAIKQELARLGAANK